MRNEINLTNEQIEAEFKKIGAGLDVSEIVFTRDTLEHFEKNAQNVLNKFKSGKTLQIDTKDKMIFIVDFGSVRGAYVTSA